jgi:cytidylate kinase
MSRQIAQIIEKQVKRWRAESQERQKDEAKAFEPANVITISRGAGSYGGEIGRKVGALLKIPVYDQEIVEHIATRSKVRLETVDTLDEQVQSRLDDYVTAIFREGNFDQSDYLHALTETIMGLWGHGPCVLIGRGATHIIYRKNSLSVRLTAPLSYRARFMMYADHIDEEAARRVIQRQDAERAAFVRRNFGKDNEDPNEYDLVINVTGLKGDDCAGLIAEAYRRKFAK